MTDAESEPEVEGGDDDLGSLFERAEETIEKIQSKADEDDLGPALSYLDDLEDIVDEAEDLLETMDLSELAHAIDWEALPEAVDVSDLPGAISDGDPADAVDVRKLLEAVDVSMLFDNVDERELWREKREFDDELDDVTGNGPDDGAENFDVDVDVDRESVGNNVDPRAIQAAVQREISEAIDEFREKLIEAHERLDAIREENQKRFEDHRTSKNSRNPTAGFSTVPSNPSKHAGAAAGGRFSFSTVPEETRYSTAPNRKRIYGNRFDSAGGDDGE